MIEPYLPAVFAASLAGSLHCAGMCGPIGALATGSLRGTEGARRGRASAPLAYHGARLLAYAALGAAAGAVGAALDAGGHWVGLQRAALLVSGALLVAFAAVSLLRLFGVPLRALPGSGPLARAARALQRQALAARPAWRATLFGAGTALLPCGWLWAFLAAAAGSGSGSRGALLLLAFGLGTIPALAAAAWCARRAFAALGLKVQLVGAIVVAGLGLWSLGARASIVGAAPPAARAPESAASLDPSAASCCHGDR